MFSKTLKHIVIFALSSFMLMGCSTEASPDAEPQSSPIVGIEWQWVSFTENAFDTDQEIPNPENFTIQFAADGNFTLKADCNVGAGTYTIEDETISIRPKTSTLAYCGDQSLDSWFNTSLLAVSSFSIGSDNTMQLLNSAGVMNFIAGK